MTENPFFQMLTVTIYLAKARRKAMHVGVSEVVVSFCLGI